MDDTGLTIHNSPFYIEGSILQGITRGLYKLCKVSLYRRIDDKHDPSHSMVLEEYITLMPEAVVTETTFLSFSERL